MAKRAAGDDLENACKRFGYDLVERLPPAAASVFLARVTNGRGRALLLKRANGVRGENEGRVAAVWAGDPAAPRHVRELDGCTFVREWIEGVPLGGRPGDIAWQLFEVGRAMRRLHAATTPAGLPELRHRFTPEGVLGTWDAALPPAMLERAADLGALLGACEPSEPALVHGDLVPGNALVRPNGSVVIIDPVGFIGMPARDLAQMAVAMEGRDRRDNLADILRGYGSAPPLIHEAFAWLAFMFLEKNIEMETARPGTRTLLVRELQELCDSFMTD